MTDRPAKKRIVVVEDTPIVAEVILDVLAEEPAYDAVAVHDGAAALALIQAAPPDLILLDRRLPTLRGLEVYDRLQAAPTTAGIPVLWVTANTTDADFAARHFAHVVAKPFDVATLLAEVAALIGPARPHRDSPGRPHRDGAG